MSDREPLRIGILGAAGITPMALVTPAQQNPDVRLVAVAARDRGRAEEFAREHGVERAVDGYDALLADPEVEAVYNPLPNGLHGPWTIATLEAGKHVLVEKPFASNLDEAEEVARVAEAHPELVVMEAFHNRHHALFRDVQQLLDDKVIGDVTNVEALFDITLPDRSNIRYNHALAGGSTMDLGCYCVHFLRHLFGEPKVLDARARTSLDPELDDALSATLELPGGIQATAASSLLEPAERQHVRIVGDRGSIEVEGFVKPQDGNLVTVTVDGHSTSHEVEREPSSYAAQLAAFVAAVRDGGPNLTGPADSLGTMRVIDDMYRAAGLQPRPVTRIR